MLKKIAPKAEVVPYEPPPLPEAIPVKGVIRRAKTYS